MHEFTALLSEYEKALKLSRPFEGTAFSLGIKVTRNLIGGMYILYNIPLYIKVG